ncbi:HAD-IA family hydrolase [Vibrio mediterranei]|uniref:HAD-IA family hydrolase n=1 Tax=Vibrio mediterranei TaxID=689 RepID=UPI00148BF882|nr:HAD-IA family hydrolase [Vibrio mediterranei]NOH30974.1 HAD-IA family hydrolase [Vibrio mediterranei]
MTTLSFKGLLFDLDGTLVDSIPAVTRAWSRWGESKGLEPSYVMSRIHGRPAIESIAELLNASVDTPEVQAEFDYLEHYEATHTEGTTALPGAVELLNSLNELGIPWAIVTSGTLPVATARMKAANLPQPKILVTPELLSQGKPHPEPYLRGAKELNLNPEECICFEDAVAGLNSGIAAGCQSIAVLSHSSRSVLPDADGYIFKPSDIQIEKTEHGFTLTL